MWCREQNVSVSHISKPPVFLHTNRNSLKSTVRLEKVDRRVTRARYQQVSVADTPYYHCISRCVRRAYLCGDDPVSGRNFDHRKRWLVERVKQLSSIFAIDVCAYAVMSNHYHLVLHIDSNTAAAWDEEEVVKRWTELFPVNGKIIDTLALNGESNAAQQQLRSKISQWRDRLQDISWFMRCLNETIARHANREDDCKGRFWEGRFKSQALLDEKALVTCMAYVDLNPVRAGLTDSLEGSDFTSIQERLIGHARRVRKRSYRQQRLLHRRNVQHLMSQSKHKQGQLLSLSVAPGIETQGLPLSQGSYITLLEETCKALQLARTEPNKAVALFSERTAHLEAIGISPQAWLTGVEKFNHWYGPAAGAEASLCRFQRRRIHAGASLKYKDKWIRGIEPARRLYGT